MERGRILVVDDEVEIADLVGVYLENDGFVAVKCSDAAGALAAVAQEAPDAAILDVMLPDMDGFALCGELRKNHTFPILMLTAKGEDLDKITGLTLGADDYVTKPFNPMELLARVKAQLRRSRRYSGPGAAAKPGRVHEFRGLYIDADAHKCSLYGKALQLTPLEFSILWYLCDNRGRVVGSEELFEAVWGEDYMDSNNTVMAHIARLREKMGEAPRRPRFVKTVWGVGYQIEDG